MYTGSPQVIAICLVAIRSYDVAQKSLYWKNINTIGDIVVNHVLEKVWKKLTKRVWEVTMSENWKIEWSLFEGMFKHSSEQNPEKHHCIFALWVNLTSQYIFKLHSQTFLLLRYPGICLTVIFSWSRTSIWRDLFTGHLYELQLQVNMKITLIKCMGGLYFFMLLAIDSYYLDKFQYCSLVIWFCITSNCKHIFHIRDWPKEREHNNLYYWAGLL